jgi:serine/threonine-protein kinase
VSVIDFGVEGSPYLVMDYVTGERCAKVLEGGRLEPARVLTIARQLLAGLGHAHAQGIIHRDLKPENLVLSDEPGLGEHLRILDFGLAKLRDGPAMTTGLAVGTPSYMSPEQTGADGAIDARTDLYAVGVLIFELLAGKKPFYSENVGELLLMHREQPPPLLRATVPEAGFSAELEAVVNKALSKFADDRFQTAADLVAALDATPEGRGKARSVAPVRAAAGGLPSPAVAPGAARLVPMPPDATIVDSPSAIRRIVGNFSKGSSAGPRDRKLLWIGVGLGGVAVAALLVGAAVRGGGSSSRAASPTASGKPAPAASAASGQGDARLEEARTLVAKGEWERAVALLQTMRNESPDAIDPVYLLAIVDLDHRRYAEGLAAAQMVTRRDQLFKSDPDLIRGIIQALASDASYERAQNMLRASGSAATPFIKEAAKRDPNPKVRDRANELLEGRGWSWSSSRGSSGGSMFHR